MADTDKYDIEVQSEFRFTKEGRHLLISQEGGIKFAILGYMFVQGLNAAEDLSTTIQKLEEKADQNEMSLMEVLSDKKLAGDIKFIMKNVSYKITGANTLSPINQKQYDEALENYSENLFGIYYVPTNEFMIRNKTDGTEIPYGLYRFNFDRTYLTCKITQDLCFSHIALIGKQYSETDDATFNVNDVQDASIVAFAKFDGTVEKSTGIFNGGVQLLADQNKYVSFQTQLRFCIKPDDEYLNDPKAGFIGEFVIPEAVSATAQKLYLINNGLKTIKGGVAIGYDKPVLDELQLDQDGSIAIDKSLVAADCIDADDAENQFNAAALFHGINKYPEDGGKYIPQYLLTTVKATSSLKEDIEAYCAGMQLNGVGNKPYKLLGKDESPESPTFLLGHLPENDFTVVDIFGRDNFNNQYTKDRMIFSFDNSATQPGTRDPNVLFRSHGNSFVEGASMGNNVLIGALRNRFSYGPHDNWVERSNENLITNGVSNSNFLFSNQNSVSSISNLTLFHSHRNHVKDSANNNTLYNSEVNSAFGNAQNNVLLFSNGNAFSGNTRENMLIKSHNNMFDQTTQQNYLDNTEWAKVTWDSKWNVFRNANHLSARSSLRDVVDTSNYTFLQNTSNNRIYNAFKLSAYSAQNNVSIGGRYFGFYPNGTTVISGVERPLASDNQSNNNLIMNGSYTTLFGCSDNTIIDTYGLRSNDSVVDPGPVRVKGSSIVGSDGSKLFNARDISLINSVYSRIDGHSDYNDKDLGLNGTSWAISEYNTGILDSVLAGEYSGGSGLSGTSYRDGAESVSTHGRPSDMLRMRTQFINTYGSELNLSEYVPSEHYTPGVAYSPYQAFKNQNTSVMEDSIKPQNSVILGGHHNKMVGGENVTFLGAEYSKASGKAHQVIMGKYNRDVPADMIFGCGHFEGDTYIQNEKEYSVNELKTIETMKGTINNVRSASKLQNALEFYAHQGKMILRNCDDGFDRNHSTKNSAYGMSVSIDPTGIQFRNGNDEIIGEMYADDLKKQSETTIHVDFYAPKTGQTGYFYVSDYETTSEALKKRWNSLNAKQRFEDMFVVGDQISTVQEGRYTLDKLLIKDNVELCSTSQLEQVNKAFFDTMNSQTVNIIFSDIGAYYNTSDYAYIELFLKLYPYYVKPNSPTRYMGKNTCKLNIYSFGTSTPYGPTSYLKIFTDQSIILNARALKTEASSIKTIYSMGRGYVGTLMNTLQINDILRYECISSNKVCRPYIL